MLLTGRGWSPLLYIQNAINKNTVEWASWVYLIISLIFGKLGFHSPFHRRFISQSLSYLENKGFISHFHVLCVLVFCINNFTLVHDFL